jgi:DNA polymerase (family X)
VPPPLFAGALLRATGSAAHVARLGALAAARGWNLDRLEVDSEAALYAALGLPEIPPELREDAGEIEAAQQGDRFADLVTVADIRGMTHCHSTFSDGRATIEDMARAAAKLGMSYMTVTDHSPTAAYAGGVTVDRLPAQWQEIAAAEAATGLRLLRGTESDILADGSLDYPGDVLAGLEVIIASIHNRMGMDPEQMTARLVGAMRQPLFKIWGHALGRLILRRDPIDCRVEEVLAAAAASRAAIEINGDPYRLDLPPEWIRRARALGLRFVISTDAHSTADLDNLPYGVAMARRGGVRKHEVLNTLPAEEFAAAVRPAAG